MSRNNDQRDHRVRVMEAVLYWEGEISNQRVRQLFGVQLVQASRLLADLRKQAPLVENTKRKTWAHSTPKSVSPIAIDEYARYTLNDGGPLVDARASLADPLPDVFAVLRRATEQGSAVSISYASMTTPEVAERVIYPHAIVHVGRRWHARAWCVKNQDYRDFTLGRIRAAEHSDLSGMHVAADDKLWKKRVKLEIAAHSALSPDQQRVIQVESFSGKPSKTISVRACLLEYVIQDLRAAKSEKQRPPEYQLEVANLTTLEPFLMGSH